MARLELVGESADCDYLLLLVDLRLSEEEARRLNGENTGTLCT